MSVSYVLVAVTLFLLLRQPAPGDRKLWLFCYASARRHLDPLVEAIDRAERHAGDADAAKAARWAADMDVMDVMSRFLNGGPGDDVVVVANFSNKDLQPLTIGVPRGGRWRVRFNSGANVYDAGFQGGNSFDTDARAQPRDGLNFSADVGIGPYSVVILSQD